MARYNSWAQGSKRHPHGLIGPAGEAAVRGALVGSGSLQLATPGGSEVHSLLGIDLAGPLDSAGFLIPFVDGIPEAAVTVRIEVKNIRSWIYPQSMELYQLLSKAVSLQAAKPNQPILPVIVARRVHKTTYFMAKQLGFFAIETRRQYAGDVISEPHLLEVRNELHLNDLTVGHGPDSIVAKRFLTSIPTIATEWAEKWRETAVDSPLGHRILAIRASRSEPHRLRLVAALRADALSLGLSLNPPMGCLVRSLSRVE